MSNTATILQQQTIADSPAGWSQTLAVGQFDTLLGTLQSVVTGVTLDTTGGVAVESLDAAPSSIAIQQSGNVDVTDLTGALLADAASETVGYATLAAYDGRTDYAGSSGTVVALNSSGTAVAAVTSTNGIAPFIGTGAALVTANAGANLEVSGPANMLIDSQTGVGAGVDLQYDYIPATSGGSNYGADASLFLTGYLFDPTVVARIADIANPVTTAAQTFVLPTSPTGSQGQIEIAQFNPALGTLQEIDVTLGGTVATAVGVENKGIAPGDVAVTQVATVELGLLGMTAWASAPIDTTATLGGFDGTADFAGTSGTIVQEGASIQPVTSAITDPTDLAAFTGTSSVAATFGSAGTADLQGPGNLLALLTADAGATASVSYVYMPAGVSTDAIGWQAPIDGEWTDPGWGLPVIDPFFGDGATLTAGTFTPDTPQSTDDVAITTPGTYTITIDAAASVHSIVIDSPDATVLLDANLTAANNFVLDAGTIEFNGGTISAGNITLNGGLLTGETIVLNSANTIAVGGGSIVAGAALDLYAGTGAITSGATVIAATGLVSDDPGVPGFNTVASLQSFEPAGGGTTAILPKSYSPWSSGTNVSAAANLSIECFARGTRIATPGGDARVEDIAVGDIVRLASGVTAPVIWIGRRRVDCRRHPKPETVWPVRIRKGAFGGGVPRRDLMLSPDHAVLADRVLIPVKHLINGSTVQQLKRDTIEYFHIELPRHGILLAEGLTVESYLDVGNRGSFINAPGPVALHADFATRVWEAEGCAPLVVTGPMLDALRCRLDMIAGNRLRQRSARAARG